MQTSILADDRSCIPYGRRAYVYLCALHFKCIQNIGQCTGLHTNADREGLTKCLTCTVKKEHTQRTRATFNTRAAVPTVLKPACVGWTVRRGGGGVNGKRSTHNSSRDSLGKGQSIK
jgi:hypothetical protein